jgi:hypothetical protein
MKGSTAAAMDGRSATKPAESVITITADGKIGERMDSPHRTARY